VCIGSRPASAEEWRLDGGVQTTEKSQATLGANCGHCTRVQQGLCRRGAAVVIGAVSLCILLVQVGSWSTKGFRVLVPGTH
jgi:hypothetical protein